MTKGDLIDIKKKRELFSDYLINIDSFAKVIESASLKDSLKKIKEDFYFANKAIQDMSFSYIEHMTHDEYKNRLRPFDGLGIVQNSILSVREDYEFDKTKFEHTFSLHSLKILSSMLAGTVYSDISKNPKVYPSCARYKGAYTRFDIMKDLPSDDKIETFMKKFSKSETKYRDMAEIRAYIFNETIFAFAEAAGIISKDKAGTNTRFEQIAYFATGKKNIVRTDEAPVKIAKGLWDELSEQEKTGNPHQIDDEYVEDLLNRTLGVYASLLTVRKKFF